MTIQSEFDPSPTRSEENNPFRVRGKGYPTPTPTSRSKSELDLIKNPTLRPDSDPEGYLTLKLTFNPI